MLKAHNWLRSLLMVRRLFPRSVLYRFVYAAGLLALATILLIGRLSAQTESATILGRVTDNTGAVVKGVDIEVRNIDTNIATTSSTNAEGLYRIGSLKPGRYVIVVQKQGFKTVSLTGLNLNVQDNLIRNFTLQIGAVSESITVKAESGQINTTDASVSTVIDRDFVEKMPLNGRTFNALLQLTPGVVIAPVSPAQRGQFSIGGQRTDANNFTVDGVSANFGVAGAQNLGESGSGGAQAFSATGATSSLVSVDALQEFRIETSSFAPQFGRSPGGQVILSTRSGTNDLHGGLFDYFRNDAMDANNWFNNAATPSITRPAERHNDFGGFLGGPIWKNRTFFFFSYEGARLRLPNSAVVQVPYLDSGTCSAAPSIAPFLKAYPKPNGPFSTSTCTGQFTGSWSDKATLNATSLRIDHTFNERFSIFERYNHAPSQIQQRELGLSLSDINSTNVNTDTLTIGVNMLLSNRISNTVHGNYSTQNSNSFFTLDSLGGATPISPNLLLGNLPVSDNAGFFDTFDTSPYIVGPSGRNQTRQLNFTDDLAITSGVHQLKFGADYRAIFLDASFLAHQFDASVVSSEVFYFALSVPSLLSSGSASFLSANANRPARLLTQATSVYAQDTWNIAPRLTLTYGLRWELDPAPSPRGQTRLPAWENTNNPSAIALAPFGTPMWATTYGNVAPRIGLVYALNKKRDFVFRAGTGIFYDTGAGGSAQSAFNFTNNAFKFTATSVPLPVTDPTPFLPTFTLQPPFPSGTQGFTNDLRLPRSYQWNLALEKSFGAQVFSATYVGQAGRSLLRQEALAQPSVNFQPGADFLLSINGARSNYNALEVQFRRPLSAHLQALLNYTWSHSLDNASNDVVAALPTNVISAAKDYASSNFDVRHSFSGAFTYDVPSAVKSGPLSLFTKGWSLQSLVVARSGFPFNALAPQSVSPVSGGFVNTRPDRVPGEPVWIANPAAAGGKSLNPNAFSIPSTIRQGTEGRNDISGFGLTQIDMSITRNFPISERINLQFRTDAFNLLNHPNFTNPLGLLPGTTFLSSKFMLNQGLGGVNPLFQEGGPRSLQLSLKLSF
jgi:Carboxypeptidase regulatory-like domain/TonB dependent receptor-like, beta-barrel/TonB-dependent Receptor Plug Domain